MLDRLFPRTIDNDYHGHKLALWLFGLVLLLRTVMSMNAIFNGYTVATIADGIPLDTFSPDAARTVLSLFAAQALTYFAICLLGMIALVRYRAMIPLLFALLLFLQSARRLLFQFLPLDRSGAAFGPYVNLGLVVAIICGLALSLWQPAREYQRERPSNAAG